MQCESIALH